MSKATEAAVAAALAPTGALLVARKKTHGEFTDHARITQRLKGVIRDEHNDLSPVAAESLDMIVHKIGRILAGDPDFKDHWDDIAGYATLVSNRLPS